MNKTTYVIVDKDTGLISIRNNSGFTFMSSKYTKQEIQDYLYRLKLHIDEGKIRYNFIN